MSNGAIPPGNLPMTLAREVFERLARRTWMLIPMSHHFGCGFLETTFTDTNLFEIAVAQLPGVRVYKAHGSDEPEKGFDWEFWIGRLGRFWRYSVQAKLLRYVSQRYHSLRRAVAGRQQIEILEDFSINQGTIPLYCFYNAVSDADAAARWHCNLLRDNAQLGCTVVPLDAVRPYTEPWSTRSFANLHADDRALPWRCLVSCPQLLDDPRGPLGPPDRHIEPLAQLPEVLMLEPITDRGTIRTIHLPRELYSSELGGYPKNIGVIEVKTEDRA